MLDKQSISIKEVAKLANVSTATVSRVLNNKSGYSKKTEERVKQAIRELNYQPNKIAQALKSNSFKVVAISVPTIWHPFFSEFLYNVELQLSAHGYSMLVSSNEKDPKRELDFLKMAEENKVTGIIAISYNNLEPYLSSSIPFVSIDRYFDSSKFSNVAVVTSDNYAGGQLALKELVGRGAKSVAYLGSFAPFPNSSMLRKEGFVNEAQKNGVPFKLFEAPEKTTNEELIFNQLLEQLDSIDGVFAVNDSTALKLLKFLQNRSISIPEDLQIVGFDGFNYMSNVPSPISSVTQSALAMAESATNNLLNIVNHGAPLKEKLIPISFRAGLTTKEFHRRLFF